MIRFIVVTFLLILLWSASAYANELREVIFKDAQVALNAAKDARADVLSPKSFEDATRAYERAGDRLEKGDSIDRIKRDISVTLDALKTATQNVRLAEVTMAGAIQARTDALKASAQQYAPGDWSKADAKFRDAALKVEAGNTKSAEKLGGRSGRVIS